MWEMHAHIYLTAKQNGQRLQRALKKVTFFIQRIKFDGVKPSLGDS